jgi:AmiR/NasT family two-component response regulator
METRDLIGQAKGILMERHRVTGDQAFKLLVRASQATNTKLRDIADELVATGELRPPRT